MSKQSTRAQHREHPELSSQQLAADCLTHFVVGKNGECVVKSHPYPSRAHLQHLCRTVELLTGLLFTVEADQAPMPMLLEVSAPLIQLCPALQ